jgi:outer membrane protein assembly factor BamB
MKPTKIIAALAAFLMMAVLAAPAVSADAGKGVDLTATVLEPKPEIGIELSANALDFGELYPGDTSDAKDLKVTNIGLKEIDVTATATDDGSEPLFVPGLLIDGASCSGYLSTLAANEYDDTKLALNVPIDYASRGEASGGAVLWAEEHSGNQGTTVLFDGTATVTAGSTFAFTAEDGTAYTDLPVETDLGALSNTGLAIGADDKNYPNWWIDSIGGIPNEPWPGYSWAIFINDALATHGLGDNHLADGDNVKFYYLTYDPDTYAPLIDEALYVVDIDVAIQTVAGASWELFHGDQQLTGYYGGDAPDTNSQKWVSDNIGCVGGSSFAVGDGKLFVYCLEGSVSYIAALDLVSGDLIWKEQCSASNPYGSWATPAYHDGLVFTPGDVARYASDGEPAWSAGHILPDNTNGGPMVADGKVFIGNWDGSKYFAFDEKTGEQLWEFAVSGTAQGTPAYDDGKLFLTSWIYGGTPGGYIYCVNANNGNMIWTAESFDENGFCGSPCVSGGCVYATTYNFYGTGDIYCIRESDGNVEWSKDIIATDSTPAVFDGKVYVTSGASGFSEHITYCFDAANGDLKWSTTADQDIGGWTASVVIADGKVFVGREGAGSGMNFGYDKLFALDADTGEIVWEVENGGGTVAIYDGVIFTADIDGKVYAYGA